MFNYYRPSKCGGRVYLHHKGEAESPPGPYEEVLQRLGERHERLHLESFKEYIDLSMDARLINAVGLWPKRILMLH